MRKLGISLAGALALALAAVFAWVVPALADGASGTTLSASKTATAHADV